MYVSSVSVFLGIVSGANSFLIASCCFLEIDEDDLSDDIRDDFGLVVAVCLIRAFSASFAALAKRSLTRQSSRSCQRFNFNSTVRLRHVACLTISALEFSSLRFDSVFEDDV